MCRHLIWGLLLLMFSTYGCKEQNKSEQSSPLLRLETTKVILDTLPVEREFIGYLQPNFSVSIQPRVNAWLMTKHYENGMPVRRGQRLFTLDASEAATTRLAALAEVESARAQLLEAKNNYERAVPLARLEAISQAQLDQYTAQYTAAQASLNSAEQSLRSAELRESYTLINSPIDGVAASSAAHSGDYVGPGTQFEVLTTISNIDTLSVDLALPMREYLALGGRNPEQNEAFVGNLRLYLSDGSYYPYAGSYAYTKKDVSSAEGTLLFSVNFPNPERLLKAGQFARVKADLGGGHPTILVPQQAVMQAQGTYAVWVVEADSTVHYRRIEVGETVGDKWRVVAGVTSGERLLINGLQKVKNGMKINY